jgi:hypothetical protein
VVSNPANRSLVVQKPECFQWAILRYLFGEQNGKGPIQQLWGRANEQIPAT